MSSQRGDEGRIQGGEDDAGPALYYLRCGWCGAYAGEVDWGAPCPEAIDHDPETGEPYICGPHQFGPLEYARREVAWRPIETAPKDRRVIVTWETPRAVPTVAEWHIESDRWRYSRTHGYLDPTHWQPLPAPPESAVENETPTPEEPA